VTFLNLALLGGLAAFAVPILIHLFHKSRFRVVKWGAMHLLEEVLRTNRRRVKIEQWILLALRAAIPAVLALCMARPIWTGVQQLLGTAKTSTLILLDDSYSMDASRAGTSNFSLARDEAARLLNELPRGSDAQVVLLGQGGATLLDQPTYDLARLTQALGRVSASAGVARVPAAFDAAAGILGQTHEPSRQIILISDFQRVSFEATEDALLGQTIERLRHLPVAPQITFWDVGGEVRDNVAVESLDFSRLMIGVGQKIQIYATVRNFGEASYPDLRLYFKVDGKEKAVSQVKLGAGERTQVLFSHAFETAGSHVIEVFADADPLKADNSFLATIPVRDKLPVLLINGDPHPDPLKGETDFLEIALQPYGSGGRVELADLIKTTVLSPERLTAQAVTESAVVILANVRKLSDEQVRALEEFVRNGGGLLIFPGNRIDAAWYESALARDGAGLLPMSYGALAGDLKEGGPVTGVVSQRYENPALELFNDPRNGSLAGAQIRMWFRLQELGGAGMRELTTLARLESGDAFLVEKSFGEGRVIACALPCDADWSDLPTRPFYLPLMQRLSVYLASTVFPPRNLDVGKPIVALLNANDAGKAAGLTLPDGTGTELPIVKKGTRGVVEFTRTQQPGLYTLLPPGGSPLHYVVNASRRESDLAKLTATEIADLAKTHGAALVRSGDEFKQLDRSRRFGMEFWRPLLWAVLALLFAEMLLQQRFARAGGRL
jgi:hypothetical protein